MQQTSEFYFMMIGTDKNFFLDYRDIQVSYLTKVHRMEHAEKNNQNFYFLNELVSIYWLKG